MNYEEKAKMDAASQYSPLRGMQSAHAGLANALVQKGPTISDRLHETLQYLGELAEIQQSMRLALIGPEPPEGAIGPRNGEPPIEGILAEVCQRAAMCVSEARALRNRL